MELAALELKSKILTWPRYRWRIIDFPAWYPLKTRDNYWVVIYKDKHIADLFLGKSGRYYACFSHKVVHSKSLYLIELIITGFALNERT